MTQTPTPLSHDEAIDELCGCSATVTVLSYQEAIEGYLALRGMTPDAFRPAASEVEKLQAFYEGGLAMRRKIEETAANADQFCDCPPDDCRGQPKKCRYATIGWKRSRPAAEYGRIHTDGSRSGGQPLGTNTSADQVEAVSLTDAFEMGFAWRGMLQGQTLEDSRAVGRTLYSDAFSKISAAIEREVKAQGFNSFQDADAGISAAWKIILAAIAALPAPDTNALVTAAYNEGWAKGHAHAAEVDNAAPAITEAKLREALLMHNDALRSACSIADRNGEETNWRAFRGQCHYTLAEYHELVNECRAALGSSHDPD